MLKVTTIKIERMNLNYCPGLKLILTDTNKCFNFKSNESVKLFLLSISDEALYKVEKELYKTSILLKCDLSLKNLSFRVSSIQSVQANDLCCFVSCILTCYC